MGEPDTTPPLGPPSPAPNPVPSPLPRPPISASPAPMRGGGPPTRWRSGAALPGDVFRCGPTPRFPEAGIFGFPEAGIFGFPEAGVLAR
jgi:hypothetical protein